MALSAQEVQVVQQQLFVWLNTMPALGIRSIMRAAGYSGAVAKRNDILTEVSAALDAQFHVTAPTVLP